VSAQNVTTSPFNIDIGGFATLGIGYADTAATSEGTISVGTPAAPGFSSGATPNDGQPVQIINNAEIHFNFSLVADNGLTFGYRAEFEMNNSSDAVDEFHGFVSGSFGEIQVGNQDGAADRFSGYYAGNVFTNAADGGGFLFDYTSTGVAVPDTGTDDTDDGSKITYYTPQIAGFRAGVSYAAAISDGVGSSNSDTNRTDEGFEFGAQYSNTFGAFSVSLGGGITYFTEDSPTRDDDTTYGAGIVVGFGGFKVSGMYSTDNQTFSTIATDGTLGSVSGSYEGFALGASYETGPWLVGVHYGQNLDAPTDDTDSSFGLSGEVVYSLAPGVRVGGVVEYASDSFGVGAGNRVVVDAVTGNPVRNDSAFAAGLFLGLTF
jgi:outer membrane protein OmpU